MTPILDDQTLEFVSRSAEQTQRLGARLGALLRGGEVICLQGPLGSGKTCLAQGVGRGWGASHTLTSPTFVLVREYTRPDEPVTLFHIDLYRIEEHQEIYSLGIDEYMGHRQAVCIIEWAERAETFVPSDRLWVEMDFVDPTRRSLQITAHGRLHRKLLKMFRQEAFGG